ncbi:MAG: glycogen/starch/alpha-glucan phosphorylase [Thiotrichales bacterium]|nr:glycogen/starch/alpha-glucan phosphorylase [Thiotrichales bacterium]
MAIPSNIPANVTVIATSTLSAEAESIKQALVKSMLYNVGKDGHTATPRDWLHTLAYEVRNRLTEHWMDTMTSYYDADTKRVYYLSLEFLIGRSLTNALLSLDIYEPCQEAMTSLGIDLEEICDLEYDAALGNGGLGRLAACFLDSMASLQLPGYGYGIRYDYGMFRQEIRNGEQVEHPDNWLRYGNPWEFGRPESIYRVKFYGEATTYRDENDCLRHQWVGTEDIIAMAYDTPVPGYDNNTVNNMRLWAAKASRDFNLQYFNEGDYIKAVEDKTLSENLSKVLYPDDSTDNGRELRLQQQYFFVSASLQDIIHRFNKFHNSFDELPDKVSIQLNDTHPAIAVAELMRILVDVHHYEWERAWKISQLTFSYTNHTLLPEALETWPVELMKRVLPRHLQIIYEINHKFLKKVMYWRPGDDDLLSRMSIIGEGDNRCVRMAHLAIVGSHKVNGVAVLHSDLMQKTIFADFHAFFSKKFINVTNGITPRRWLNQSNPLLSNLISSRIGDGWKKSLADLSQLAQYASDSEFQSTIAAVKYANKKRLLPLIAERTGVDLNPNAMFDVHVKRMHEYKRQLLNALHVITRYNEIKDSPNSTVIPRVVIFAGKAAPGYAMAKLVIRLINDIAEIVNNDPLVGDKLKVIFMPNYDVSSAQLIIPAADLSEQISTAGTEASGTGNMKLSLNGALTIGTLDGANIEIREQVGKDNFFIFGMTADEVIALKASGYEPWDYYNNDHSLRRALDMIRDGFFCPDDKARYQPIFDTLTSWGDNYCLLADYASYIICQRSVDDLYARPNAWVEKSILNIANMGKFSSDRTIEEYAQHIWNVTPVAH